MSQILVLTATPSLSRGDFMTAIERAKADTIFLVITKENRFCTESQFLKELSLTAQTKNTNLIYITSHSFTRNLIQKLGYETASQVPIEMDVARVNLADFLADKPAAQTEKTKKKSETIVRQPPIAKNTEIENPTTKHLFETHIIRPTKRYWLNRSRFFFLLCFLGAGYGLIFWWFQPHATIVVKPRISAQSILQNIVVELSEAQVPEGDAELPRVRGILVRTTIEDTEIIPAGGRQYEVTNAYGQVTLFNETSEPKFLVPSRLEAAGGLIFRFDKNVTIPARDETGPGKIAIDVVADSFDEYGKPIGNRGNIIAGTELRFPALRDELQELYYAKANRGPLVGGSTLTRYIVEEEDIERAKGIILENFRVRGIDELKKEIVRRANREDGNQVLLENPALLLAELREFLFPLDLIDQESQTFEVPAKVEVIGVVIDQAAVKKIMLKNLQKVIDDRQMILSLDDESLEYEILDADKFLEENWLKLSVKAVGIEQLDTDYDNESLQRWKQKLLQPILGKSPDEALSRLLNDPDIERVTDLILRPFWQKQLPLHLDQIELKVLAVE